MKKLLLICNPLAGTRRIVGRLPDVLDIFRTGGYETTVYMTTGHGDATQIAASRGQDFDCIVCAGGDGTFNELVDGVLSAGLQIPLGYLPCGSTNDFAASLHLPKSIPNAARQIVSGTPMPLDVGRFGSRHFSYVASFGAFTKASYATSQSSKNAFGPLAYFVSGLKDLPNIHPIPLQVEAEDKLVEEEYIFGAVSNTTSMGGVLKLDERLVDMNDGLFEVLLIKNPKDLLELNECIRAITSQNYDSRMLTFLRTSCVRVVSKTPLDWTLDGECALGVESVEITNLPSAIRLIR